MRSYQGWVSLVLKPCHELVVTKHPPVLAADPTHSGRYGVAPIVIRIFIFDRSCLDSINSSCNLLASFKQSNLPRVGYKSVETVAVA